MFVMYDLNHCLLVKLNLMRHVVCYTNGSRGRRPWAPYGLV